MKGSLGDTVRLKHILDAITEIEGYVRNASFSEFTQNSMMKVGSIKQLEIIGESASKISDDLRNKVKEIEWDIIEVDLPNLKSKIQKTLHSLEK